MPGYVWLEQSHPHGQLGPWSDRYLKLTDQLENPQDKRAFLASRDGQATNPSRRYGPPFRAGFKQGRLLLVAGGATAGGVEEDLRVPG